MNGALLVTVLLAIAPPAPATQVRRLALVVGVNDGGKDRQLLRYAVSDARSFGRVLTELGGVAESDEIAVFDRGRADLLAALEQLRQRAQDARAAGVRVEVVVYYSGHSDEEGLLVRGERVEYLELRRLLEAIPADVRLVILDSCASGAFARAKGGQFRPAFLSDASSQVHGQAILTSSAADEVAQESDRIKGSYFTHHLVSGLRGAADATHDGRITLNEAYHYAYQETLARTERTEGGAQHPAYDIAMSGSGDLVLTDVRDASSGMLFDHELSGRLFVRDAAGNLVVELNRPEGRLTEIALSAGDYVITRETNRDLSVAQVHVPKDRRVLVAAADFHAVAPELTASRGSGPASTSPTVVATETPAPSAPSNSLWVAELGVTGGVADSAPLLPQLRFGRDPLASSGFTVAVDVGSRHGYNSAREIFTETHLGFRGGYLVLWHPGDRVAVGLGGEVGLLSLWQDPAGQTWAFTVAPRAAARYRLSSRWWLGADADLSFTPALVSDAAHDVVGGPTVLVLPELHAQLGLSF